MSEGFLLGTTDWVPLVIRPGHQPYRNLAGALRCDGDNRAAADAPRSARVGRSQRNAFDAPPLGSWAARQRCKLGVSPETRLMLVVDQFEELFAFRRAADARRGRLAR